MRPDFSPEDQPGASASLRHVVAILKKWRWLALSIVGLSVVIAGAIYLFKPATFRARATVLLEREITSEKSLLFRMNPPPNYEQYDWINAELKIIESYPVAHRVVEALYLNHGRQKRQVAPSRNEIDTDAVTILQKNLMVEKIRNSNVVEVTYDHESPRFATTILNEVVKAYIKHRTEIFSESDTYRFLEEQMRTAEEKLRKLERDQVEFKQREKIVSLEDQRTILVTKLSDYEKKMTEATAKRIGKETKLAVIKEYLQLGKDKSLPIGDSPDSPTRERQIAKLRDELLGLELERMNTQLKFSADSRTLLDLDKQIVATQTALGKEAQQFVEMEEASVRALKMEERELRALMDQTDLEIQAYSPKEYEFNQISRGIGDTREVYSMLLKQREEARLSMAKLQHGIKIRTISPAMVPDAPLGRKKLYVALSLIIGLALGLSSALFAAFISRVVKAPPVAGNSPPEPAFYGDESPVDVDQRQGESNAPAFSESLALREPPSLPPLAPASKMDRDPNADEFDKHFDVAYVRTENDSHLPPSARNPEGKTFLTLDLETGA